MVARGLAVAVLLVPLVVRADRTLLPAAKAHLDVGLKAYSEGNFELAITEIEAAYQIDHDPSLLYTWAQAEKNAHRCGKAIDHYRRYLDSNPTEGQAIATRAAIATCLEALKLEACQADLHTTQPAPTVIVREVGTPWYKSPGAAALVVGAIGLGTGTGFLIGAAGSEERARGAMTRAEAVDLLDEATTRRRIGIVTLSAGGAVAIGGLAYLLTRSSPTATVSASAGGGGATIMIGGAL